MCFCVIAGVFTYNNQKGVVCAIQTLHFAIRFDRCLTACVM